VDRGGSATQLLDFRVLLHAVFPHWCPPELRPQGIPFFI
jgi:dynein heavy chain